MRTMLARVRGMNQSLPVSKNVGVSGRVIRRTVIRIVSSSVNVSEATRVPMSEWVRVRWPKRASMGFEIHGTRRPMVDVGVSMSGAMDPMMAQVITVQWKLASTPNTARMIRAMAGP